jgi:hypothetical protein
VHSPWHCLASLSRQRMGEWGTRTIIRSDFDRMIARHGTFSQAWNPFRVRQPWIQILQITDRSEKAHRVWFFGRIIPPEIRTKWRWARDAWYYNSNECLDKYENNNPNHPKWELNFHWYRFRSEVYMCNGSSGRVDH